MAIRDDERAQAGQVGAVLLLGILILALALHQAFVVPQQNKGVEFDSYLDATNDLVALHQDVVFSGTQDNVRGQTVHTGTQYPSRVIALNPPAPNGRLNATGAKNVTLGDVEAVSGEATNTRAFFNASNNTYSTRAIRFTPAYHEFDGPPILITGTSAYRGANGQVIPMAGQTLVSGDRITLVTIAGDLNTAGQSVPVTVEPVSASTRSVAITGTGSEFNLTVPTPGPADAWNNSSVASQLRSNPNVLRTSVNGTRSVDVVFNGSRTYELRLARVVVREQEDETDLSETTAKYLVPVSSESAITTDARKTLTVEVRDRYNNPVTGESVNFTATTNGTFVPSGNATVNVTTDSEGRASVQFDPGSGFTGNATVTARIDDGSPSYEQTTFEFSVVSASGGGGSNGGDTGSINPQQDVILQKAVEASGGNNANKAELTFNNTDSSARHIRKARISFYFADGGSDKRATDAEIDGAPQNVTIGGGYQTLSPRVTLPTGESTVTFTFDPSGQVNTDGDFFILTVYFEENPDRQYTYFVAVQARP